MYIGEIIKNYRTKNQLSQRAFAARASLSPSYINTLEKIYNPKTGKPYSITTDVALELSKAMFINIADLLNMLDETQEFIVNNDTKIDNFGNSVISIPILDTVKAGYDYLAQENWIGTIDVETSLVGNGEDYFALRVHGDSMSPSLIENDIVIIKKQNDFENGDLVVAIINDNEVTIKKGRKNKAGIYLQPLNTAYEPLIFTNEEIKNIPILIVGVVKQLKREF